METYSSIIYSAKNKINNKFYIGFTSRGLEARKHDHLISFQKYDTLFYRAIRKYGWEFFEWEIVYQSFDENYCLDVAEPFLIKEYNSLQPYGYNIIPGGNKGPRMFGNSNPNFGKPRPNHVLEALREGAKKSKGKSYEERYGIEKASLLKKRRSDMRKEYLKNFPPEKDKNNNYDKTIYQFINEDGRSFTGTIYDLRMFDHSLTKENTSRLKEGGKSKGWNKI